VTIEEKEGRFSVQAEEKDRAKRDPEVACERDRPIAVEGWE